MFRIQDQRGVERSPVQFARRGIVEQVQEMARDAVVVGGGLDALAVGVKPVPVQQHGRKGGEQPVGGVALPREVRLRFQVAQHRATRAQDIHGMSVGRYELQCLFEHAWQSAQRLEPVAVGGQLSDIGQMPVMEQVGDLLERGVVGQIVDVVTPVGEARTLLADGADVGPAGNDARQAAGFLLAHIASDRNLFCTLKAILLCVYVFQYGSTDRPFTLP